MTSNEIEEVFQEETQRAGNGIGSSPYYASSGPNGAAWKDIELSRKARAAGG